jgi:hypothetical protein
MISGAITIYSITGYRIWQKRVELRFVSRDSNQLITMRSASGARKTAVDIFSGANNILVTTQIECDIQQQGTMSGRGSPDPECVSLGSFSSAQILAKANRSNDLIIRPLPDASPTKISRVRLGGDAEAQHSIHTTPSSQNGYRAAVIATKPPQEPTDLPTTTSALPTSRPTGKRTAEGHAAAMAYCQVAFLMFLALFVVWLPSSINRMYQFVHKDRPSFALNVLSAIVLSLQGSWNAIIYVFTTRAECRRAWGMVVERITGRGVQYPPGREVYCKEIIPDLQETRGSVADVEMGDFFKQAHYVELSRTNDAEDVYRHNR